MHSIRWCPQMYDLYHWHDVNWWRWIWKKTHTPESSIKNITHRNWMPHLRIKYWWWIKASRTHSHNVPIRQTANNQMTVRWNGQAINTHRKWYDLCILALATNQILLQQMHHIINCHNNIFITKCSTQIWIMLNLLRNFYHLIKWPCMNLYMIKKNLH